MGLPAIRAIVKGIKGTQAKLSRAQRKFLGKIGSALFIEGEKIMAASIEIVPVAQGQLKASGHVQKPQRALGVVFVELGFGGAAAPYALKVHENPRAGKTEGVSPRGKPYPRRNGKPTWSTHPKGQWKYLEQPFKRAIPGLQKRLQVFVKTTLVRGA